LKKREGFSLSSARVFALVVSSSPMFSKYHINLLIGIILAA